MKTILAQEISPAGQTGHRDRRRVHGRKRNTIIAHPKNRGLLKKSPTPPFPKRLLFRPHPDTPTFDKKAPKRHSEARTPMERAKEGQTPHFDGKELKWGGIGEMKGMGEVRERGNDPPPTRSSIRPTPAPPGPVVTYPYPLPATHADPFRSLHPQPSTKSRKSSCYLASIVR